MTALAARPMTTLAGLPWRVLVGPNLVPSLPRLVSAAAEGVVVEKARPDFVQLIANCRVSISQAGYNTLMELMAVGARAVVVPFAQAGETEQTLRAELLAEQGLVDVVNETSLDAAGLARAVDRAAERTPAERARLDLNGLESSVRLVREALAEVG